MAYVEPRFGYAMLAIHCEAKEFGSTLIDYVRMRHDKGDCCLLKDIDDEAARRYMTQSAYLATAVRAKSRARDLWVV